MKNEISIEAQRFKSFRTEKNYTQQAFAKLLGIPSSTADIERGKTKISGNVVVQLMRELDLNPLWLFGDSEIKYNKPEQVDVLPKVITVNSENRENILLVNQKAAAGYPHNIQDQQWYERLPAFDLPLPEFRNATYRGFQVEGDSMQPNIKPKEWVIGKALGNLNELVNNRVYVVILRDSVLVKKIQKLPNPSKIRLISFNADYFPLDVNLHDIQELWQVNSKLSFGVEDSSDSYLLRQLQNSMRDLQTQINAFQK